MQICLSNWILVISLTFYVSGIYNNFELRISMSRNRGPVFDVEAEIKADFFTDIFDSMTKNMKENQKIFFIFSHKQMKIWLSQNSKNTQLELKIDKKAFKEYTCNFPLNRIIYRKYELKKFLWFSTFFQICKGHLKLTISEDRIELEDSNAARKSKFPVMGEQITEEENDELIKMNILSDMKEESSCTLVFPKSRMIQEVIHSGNAIKPSKLWFSYLSNQKKLRFDFEPNEINYLKVHAQEEKTHGSQISKVPFQFRKLKLATSLMESEKPFRMILSRNALMINYDEENLRKYSIVVLADYDD